jgi:Flp pilus assembly pilin Flp
MRTLRDDTGAAIAEFVMVAGLLTVLTLSVIQLGLALHVRNTIVDAAAEGARWGALADNSAVDGVVRTTDLIETTIGPSYARDVSASAAKFLGHPAVVITVRTPLPLFGLVGIDNGLEVHGRAAVEG